MQVLFKINPEAKLRTTMARYYGVEEFNKNFPATGQRNIGSTMRPCQYREACICCDNGDDYENYGSMWTPEPSLLQEAL
jgi:hypothetical protein